MPSYLLQILNLRSAKFLLASGALFGSTVAHGDVIYVQDFENNWNNADGLWSLSTNASLGGPYTNVMGRFGARTVNLSVFATSDNNGGYGGDSGSTPFNITVNQFSDNRNRVPHLDQGGGGGPGGTVDPSAPDGLSIDLGQAIQDQNGNNGPAMFGAGTYAVHFDLMLFDSWDGNWTPHGPDSFAVAVNEQVLFDEMFYSVAAGSHNNFRNPDETPIENVYNTRWADSIFRDITVLVELTEETDLLSIDFIGGQSQSILDESWGLDNIRIEQVSAQRSMSVPEVPAPGTLVLMASGIGLMTRRKR